MIGINVPVKYVCAGDGFNRAGDLIDRLRLAAFAEVWYTLNEAIEDF